jgi:HAD superfamily hydrolase (TIGR01549 family)
LIASTPNSPATGSSSESLPFRAILFDLGSTLIYYDAIWSKTRPERDAALIGRLRQAGISPDGNAFLDQFNDLLTTYFVERDTEFIEHTAAYLLQNLLTEWGYADLPQGVVQHALAGMYAVNQTYWKLEGDTHPTLQALRAQGYKLGLISNTGDDTNVQTLVDRDGLRPYFDVIVTSAAQGIRKPNPCIFHIALEHWGIESSQAAMVGDSLGADILGAQNAGLYSIWITRRAGTAANRAHEDTIRPDAVINSLEELPELLDTLFEQDIAP